MKILDAVGNSLAAIERLLLVAMLGTMVVLAFLQVILRTVFSVGFLWADPLLRYMVLWVGFLGAVLATHAERHFGIEFLNRFLSGRRLHAVKTVISLFASVVAVLLCRAAFQFLIEAIGAGEKDLFEISRRLYYSIIPIAFGLIALHFALHTARHLRGAVLRAESSLHQGPA